MKKIKFTHPVAGVHGTFSPDQIAELPDDYANGVIDARHAIEIGFMGREKSPKTERATLKRKGETPEGVANVDAEETA